MPGSLYVVATPIGNLEDITLRAVRVLGEVAVIACEDTRQTGKLLQHFGIRTPTISYHDHNEAERSAELVERMLQGESVALVSDAGTPLISDPGYRLVRAALAAAITVVPLPGASAALGALAASGLATDAFRFCGFLPPKSGQRRKALQEACDKEASGPDGHHGEATLIFYEAPHRILDALEDIEAVCGIRPVVIARELTKLHEEFLRGTAAEIRAILAARPSIKGEFTLLIGKGEGLASHVDLSIPVLDAVQALEKNGVPRMDAIKQVARERGLSKRDVYKDVTG
ncbi:MAG: 16S rRNA (cytidine(1402)-2'-O)-methyltransferase [Acidobacteriota bacterium]